jgi:hypothetical protein
MLQGLEDVQAPVIKKIIEQQNLNGLTMEEWINLHTFLLLQFARTKDARMIADNYVDFFVKKYIKPMMKGREEFKEYSPEYIDSLKITMPNLYKFFIGTALSGVVGISDLKPLLLVNKTQKHFISSDAPVVKNNYFKITNNDLTGFQSPGLQIFCPLNENLLLLLIHGEAYEIIGEHDSIVELTNTDDIDSLNQLQVLNGLEIVLFADQTDIVDIRRIHEMSVPIKSNKKFSEKTINKTKVKEGGYSEMVRLHLDGINYRLHFSFIRRNHKYSRWFRIQCKINSKKFPIIMPYRSKKLIEMITDNFDLLVENAKKHEKKIR